MMTALLVWPLAVFLLSAGMGGALDRDIDRMWETKPFRDGMVAATPAAMNAARRVFRSERSLRGLTMAQARALAEDGPQESGVQAGQAALRF